MTINTIKSLWKLNIAQLLPQVGVHQKAHSLSYCLAIIDVVITIQIQHEWCICKHSRNSNLWRIHNSKRVKNQLLIFRSIRTKQYSIKFLSLPKHSWHQLSCGVDIQVVFHVKYTQVVAIPFLQHLVPQHFLNTPAK